MTDLTLFTFESHELRIVDQAGEPWFVLKDVLSAMGTTRTTAQAIASIKHHLGEGYINDIPLQTKGGMQPTTIAAEPAVTFLVSRGNTDDSRRLNRFIHVEALPSIRKTGGYSINPAPTPTAAPVVVTAAPEVVRFEGSWKDYALFMEAKHGCSYRAPTPVVAPVAAPVKPAPRPVTAEEEARVVALFNGGMSKNAIGKLLGRSPRTIGRILDRATRESDPQTALRLLDGGAS